MTTTPYKYNQTNSSGIALHRQIRRRLSQNFVIMFRKKLEWYGYQVMKIG